MIDARLYTRADEALGEGEAFLAQVIETTAEALVIVAADGRITFLNAAAEQLLGLRRDASTGRPYTDVGLELLTPGGEPLPAEEQPAAQVLRTGEVVHEADGLFERPDGKRIGVSTNAGPLTDADGHVTGSVISLRDATARRQAEEALRQHAAVQRARAELLDLAHDAIFVRDVSTGLIRYWNRGAEQLYGFPRDEAVGKVSHELLQTRFPEPLAAIEDTTVQKGLWDGELIHRTRDGSELTIESRWALQRDVQGEPIAFLEVNRDVTARMRAEAELAQRIEELGRANEEIVRRHREITAVNRSMAAISRSLDLSEVLQNIVDAARELIQARYAALGVADAQGRITQFITSGITPEQRSAIGPLPQGHGLLGALITEAKPLRVRNIASDPRGHGFPPNHPPMTSLLGVPILSKGRAVGDLYLTDKTGAEEFSENDQELLMVLARHAAVAIENGQLYEDVRGARDQLRTWNRDLEAAVAERTREIEQMTRERTVQVLQAQEDERGRIARELHDETAQALAKLLIDLDVLKLKVPASDPVSAGLDRLEHGLTRALDEVRALSHDLRPAILEDFGLVAAIQSYSDDWMHTFGVPVWVEAQPEPEDRLPSDVEIALFRIAQEAMMNVGKYAGAREVRVSLSFADDAIQLVVQDDGVGFEPDDLSGPSRQGGLGLFGMRERAALLAGSLTIESGAGQGTRVSLVVPVP